MALGTSFTQITKSGLSSTSAYDTGHINSSGIITATKFVGTLEGNVTSDDWTNTATGISTTVNVGIGTTNATSKLTVSGTVSVETGGSERLRITSAGRLGIGDDNPASLLSLKASNPTIRFTDGSTLVAAIEGDTTANTFYGYNGADIVFSTNSGASYADRLRINSSGQIITGGGSGISFNNVGNSAFGSFLEVNGTHTTNHHGVLGISGITTTNNARVGLLQFLNTSNTNSSSTANAASRSLAHISVYADTSDGNAGNDSGGRIVIGTKGEAAGMNDLLFLTSDKTVGIQAIPAVGDMNSTATGGAALSDPKLYVQDGGTNGKYNLMIRCNSGSDADNTGSAIALNHSNDRGILIEGGRWSGNRSWGAIKAIDNTGRVTDGIAIRGGNGAGIQDFRIYTGEAVATTERLRITNAGNVGINSTIPRSKLHVANGNSAYNPGNPTGLGAGAVACLESSGDVALQFLSSTTTDNFIYFGDTSSATTGSIQYDHNVNSMYFNVNGGQERFRINHLGHAKLLTGNLEFASGNGIDFSANPDGSRSVSTDGNKFDEYEEGTFTPSINGMGSIGYNTQVGKYTKIGNTVFFQIRFDLSSRTAGSHAHITNMPFTASTATIQYAQCTVYAITGLHCSSNHHPIGQFQSSEIYLYQVGYQSSSNYSAMDENHISGTAQFGVFGFYYTAT